VGSNPTPSARRTGPELRKLAAAVRLGRDERLQLVYRPDLNGARPGGSLIGTVDGVDVDLTTYDGALVEVLREDTPRESEPLRWVRTDDGAILPAWTSQLGM
jgi:hypothetical protein